MTEMEDDQTVLEWGNPLPEAKRHVGAGHSGVGMPHGCTYYRLEEREHRRGRGGDPDRPSGLLSGHPTMFPPPRGYGEEDRDEGKKEEGESQVGC
jgi:hypothetical protein